MHHFIYRFLAVIFVVASLAAFTLKVPAAAKESSGTVSEGLSLKEEQKVLYLGGCTGKKADGKKAKYYSSVSVRKLIDGFSTKKYDIVLKSSDEQIASVDSKKDRIYAQGVGETYVSVTVKEKKTEKKKTVFKTKLQITVKKNADPLNFIVEGISDGQILYEGDSLIVDFPGDYTDIRKVVCEEEGVSVKPIKDGNSFSIIFDETGEYTVSAFTYQSKKYNGYTAYAEFDIVVKEREAEIRQISAESIEIIGGPVDEDMTAEALSVYEVSGDIDVFFSYASKLELADDSRAVLTLFRPLESEKKYELAFDGLRFPFTSAACTVQDVADFTIAEDSIRAGEESKLSFMYYNKKKIDITAAVASELDSKVKVRIKDPDFLDGYLSGRMLYLIKGGISVELTAKLEADTDQDGKPDISLETEKTIVSSEKKGSQFTGNVLYTLAKDDGKYLTVGDKCTDSAPLGDSVIFEALLEMDDGSYKNLKQAGVTKIIAGNPEILMMGSEIKAGGYSLILNSPGESGVVLYKGDELICSCKITVLPERKPDTLKVEPTKQLLNTNEYVEDYILIKADLYDQYGDIVEGAKFDITQTEQSKRNPGEAVFSQISDGRFLVYGYDCPSTAEQRKIGAVVSSGNLSQEIGFYIRNVEYDDKKTDYSYGIKLDGSKFIDTAFSLVREAPKSTFVNIEIKDNGYYVGEGIGYFFEEQPTPINGAEYYGGKAGENFYGISILYTDDKGNKRYLTEDEPCVLASYLDFEFCPYTYMEKLPSGTYEVTAYSIELTDSVSRIKKCDSVVIRVIDSDPEIEVEQLIQSYSEKPKDGWENTISEYFSFKFEGEDISEYISKVDCVESSSGSVFVKSVEFAIPDPDYGIYTKTALVERLITKQ